DWDDLHRLLDKGYAVEAVEIRAADASDIQQLLERVPAGVTTYFEVPLCGAPVQMLSAVETAGARVKLRMGGTVAEAFPSPRAVAQMLGELSQRQMIFKATAGLHHA